MAKTTINTKTVGAGLAAAAAAGAAAASYYFYASKDAKAHRKAAAKWASDLKRDVVKQAQKVPKMDRTQLMKIIDGAAATYETVRSIDQADLKRAAQELKKNWTLVAQEATGNARKIGADAKKTAKRARATVKKSAKKVAKKRR